MSRPTFGICPFPSVRFGSIGEMIRCIQVAEDLGYERTYLPSHLLVPAWPSAADSAKVWHDPIVLATAITAATSEMVVETNVLVIPYYSPVPLAKALATADVVSGGRLRVGVGSGWMKAEFRRLGIDYDLRGDMTDEYLRAMQALWTMDVPKFEGRWVSFEDCSFLPRPLGDRGLPIVVGGVGPRPLRRVAELGVGWHPLSGGPDAIRQGLEQLAPLMEARGRQVSEVDVGYTFATGIDPEFEEMQSHSEASGGGGQGQSEEGDP